MLREDWETMVDDVLIRSMEQADLFKDTAHHIEEKAAQELCARMAEKRLRLSRTLEDNLRARGRFPKVLDPEREVADHWLETVKSALSGHEAESLLHSRLAADEDLDKAITEALAEKKLPPDLREILDEAWRELETDRRELAAFLAEWKEPR